MTEPTFTPYERLLAEVFVTGHAKSDRTGTGTFSLFGKQMRFDLSEGFPLITTKKVHFKSVVGELLWFLSGSTDANELRDKYGVTIWDEWAGSHGDLGPIYGHQWRSWDSGWDHYWDEPREGIDQISAVIDSIRNDPNGRRHIVSAWNPTDIPNMALPPCHVLFQFYVADGKLSCQLYQRSADMFLGVPFNIASYALLTHMIAQQTDLEPGEFIWTGGDVHLYRNHVDQAIEQINRDAQPWPQLVLNKRDSIFDYTPEDIQIVGYSPHPAIKAPVAV